VLSPRLRTLVLGGAVLLLLVGAVVAWKPFRGAGRGCGSPLLAVNYTDTRPQIEGIARLAARTGVTREPPSASEIAAYDRLVRAADRYEACRDTAVRRMTVADVMVVVGLAAIGACFWRRQGDRSVSSSIAG
jgi:hypothetical protein